jgi:dihydropteroate synthase
MPAAAQFPPTIVGVINVSPESPNRLSVATTVAEALRLARRHVRNGAAIVDVGGRSSSADAAVVSDSEEQQRVLPVIATLKAHGFIVSLDTWSNETAALAVAEGADIINFTGTQPSLLLSEAAGTGRLRLCLCHMPFGDPYEMRAAAPALPSMEQIVDYFRVRIARMEPAVWKQLILDPNIGMLHPAIRSQRSLGIAWRQIIISRLDELLALGVPLMLALPRRDGPGATKLWTAALLNSGAAFIRSHDPRGVTEMAALVARLRSGQPLDS